MIETKKDIERNLPKGWRWERLGNIVDLQAGIAFKKSEYSKEGVRLFQIANVSFNYIKWEEIEYLPKNYINTYPNLLLHPGDIVMALNRPLLNDKLKIAEIRNSDTPAILYQRVGRFKFLDNESSRYFLFFLQSPSFISWLKDQLQGVNIPFINKSKLLSFNHYPKCLLATQQAIVSKIEELFSELDKGIENLRTAQQQLKTYRQAVLKWAFVNDSFKRFILKDVTEKIQIGPFGTQLHKEDYIEDGIPLINPTHIKGGFITADISFSILKSKRDSLPNYILKEGDVIMGRRGEMGRCGLVTKKEVGWFCGTGSLYYRPDVKKVNPVFLYYNLSSQSVKKYLDDNAGGTTMANLNLKIVNDIPILLPSIIEQNKIVLEIESRLSVADKMEESIIQSLQQAEGLRQSILKKAFEGKLIN